MRAITRYIDGVAIDAIIIGCLAFIGYSVIGLNTLWSSPSFEIVISFLIGPSSLIPMIIIMSLLIP